MSDTLVAKWPLSDMTSQLSQDSLALMSAYFDMTPAQREAVLKFVSELLGKAE